MSPSLKDDMLCFEYPNPGRKAASIWLFIEAPAQLVFEGAGPLFKSCTAYMNSWTKEANNSDLKTTFIQGKKKAKGRLWKLIIVAEEPEDITAVDDEMYKELSAQCRKANALAKERGLSH